MEKQIAFSFDKDTVRKIVKSLWIAVIAPTVVYGFTLLGSIHFHTNDPYIDYVLIYAVPVIINGAIEWVKGKSKGE